ncbi:hypothetical protein [Blastomonas sp. AAP53]|uniref:hypothetical protein n=1 Tax=Blastomonas sp. AAP53 TaxID=1248760 RepID=UPI00030A4A5F|nr:hypothetical protein [Blastomonas sp. AAP53]
MHDELALVMVSPEFVRSPVLRRLLEYLVEQTLAGNGDRLKAYQIAVEGLGRDDSFDPQSDSYPRVQVGRLRKMLDLHYAGLSPEQASGRQRIVIPVGHYNVTLEALASEPVAAVDVAAHSDASQQPPRADTDTGNDPAQRAQLPAPGLSASGPAAGAVPPMAGSRGWIIGAAGVLVLLGLAYVLWQFLASNSSEEAARRDMRTQLAHVSIITDPAGGSDDLNTAAQMAEMHLQRFEMLAVSTGGHNDIENGNGPREYQLLVRGGRRDGERPGGPIYMTLRHIGSGTTLWSYEIAQSGSNIAAPDIEQAIGNGISIIARSGGVIVQHQRKLIGQDMSAGYPCLIHYDGFRQRREAERRPALRQCLARSLKMYPNEPLLLQALSYMELSNPERGRRAPLVATQRGRELAEAALEFDSKSSLAQIAVARSALVRGNCPRSLAFSRRAVESNPLEPDTLGLAGTFLLSCGDYAGAEPVLERARELNEQPGGYQTASLVIARVINGKPKEALDLAQRADSPELDLQPNFLLAKALAFGANGRLGEARQTWRALEQAVGAQPGTAPVDVLESFTISPFFTRRMLAEVEATGIVPLPN